MPTNSEPPAYPAPRSATARLSTRGSRVAAIPGIFLGLLVSGSLVAPTPSLAKPAHYKVTNIQNKQKNYLLPLSIDINGLVTGQLSPPGGQGSLLGDFQAAKGYFGAAIYCDAQVNDFLTLTAVDSLDDEAGTCGPNNFLRLASNGVSTSFLVNGSEATITGITADTNVLTGNTYSWNGTYLQAHGFLGQIGNFQTIDPPGSMNTYPTAISPRGRVAGYFYNAADVMVGFTLINGVYDVFSVPGGIQPIPAAINDAGHVAGNFVTANSEAIFGFAYQAGSAPIVLTANGWTQSLVGGMNETGQIAGGYIDATDTYGFHAVMWAPWTGNLVTFDAPAGSNDIRGIAINANAQIAGLYLNAKGAWTLFSATCVGSTCQ